MKQFMIKGLIKIKTLKTKTFKKLKSKKAKRTQLGTWKETEKYKLCYI